MDLQALQAFTIKEPEFTKDFVLKSTEMGFFTLGAIVSTSHTELRSRKGFTYRWLGELSAYLERNKLLHLLQPIPGKNPG